LGKIEAAGVDDSTAGRLIASAILPALRPPLDVKSAERGQARFFAVNYGALLPFRRLLVVPSEAPSSIAVS
jgi:hypothetical protein